MSFLDQHQLIKNQKRLFDASNENDVRLLKTFMVKTSWGGPCPFILEEPYLDMPSMMKDKYIKLKLGIK